MSLCDLSNELNIFIETNTDCNAMGSVTWDCAGHHVVFSVYGPKESKSNEELTHRAFVDILITPQTGQRTSKEMELELYLNSVLERVIDVKEFPRCKISGLLFIVAGVTTDPRTVASALNAASLALILSGLPLKATIASVYVKIDYAILAITIDVTHHKLSVSKGDSDEPTIFSIYTGLLSDKDSSIDNSKPLFESGFSIKTLLELIKIPHTPSLNTKESCFTSSLLYKQAMELVNTMATQIVSYTYLK